MRRLNGSGLTQRDPSNPPLGDRLSDVAGQVVSRSWTPLLILPVVLGPPSAVIGTAIYLARMGTTPVLDRISARRTPLREAAVSFLVGAMSVMTLVAVFLFSPQLSSTAGDVAAMAALAVALGLWTFVVDGALKGVFASGARERTSRHPGQLPDGAQNHPGNR